MKFRTILTVSFSAIVIAATQTAAAAATLPGEEACPVSLGRTLRNKRSTESFWKGMSDDVPKYITEIKASTQYEFLAKHNLTVVMYYAPWCGHSVRARATFLNRAIRYGSFATFAALNADNFIHDCIKWYPTFIAFKNGQYITELGKFTIWSENEFEKALEDLPHGHYDRHCEWSLVIPTTSTPTPSTTSNPTSTFSSQTIEPDQPDTTTINNSMELEDAKNDKKQKLGANANPELDDIIY